jgi:hypothetical protein
MKAFALAIIMVALIGSAHAANRIPDIFLGRWGADLDVRVNHITETNYECDIKNVREVKDLAGGKTFQVDMRCTTFPPESNASTANVTSLWGIRDTSAGDVLVITTLPSTIQVFQRNWSLLDKNELSHRNSLI